jgi:trans-aconitate methyltransferase
MLIILLVVIVFFLLAAVAFFVFSLDAVLRGHDLPTSREAVRAVADIITKHKPDARVVYDLGSGRGTFALKLKEAAPHLTVRAVDKGHVRVFISRLKARALHRDAAFERSDLFKADLSKADVVYTYLWYSIMPPLERHLRATLKPGTIVITNTSYFPTWELVATHRVWPQHEDFERLFIYRV